MLNMSTQNIKSIKTDRLDQKPPIPWSSLVIDTHKPIKAVCRKTCRVIELKLGPYYVFCKSCLISICHVLNYKHQKPR